MHAPWLLLLGIVCVLAATRALWTYIRRRPQLRADDAEELAIERYELQWQGYTYHWVALGRFLRSISVVSAGVVAVASVALVYMSGGPVVSEYVQTVPPVAAQPASAQQPAQEPSATPAPAAQAADQTAPAAPKAAPTKGPAAGASASPGTARHAAAPAVASASRVAAPSPAASPSPSPSAASAPR